MTLKRNQRLILAALLGVAVFLVLFFSAKTSRTLLGRVLDGDELLRVQVESDFDRDGDIDFLDFTVFSAFYEEA